MLSSRFGLGTRSSRPVRRRVSRRQWVVAGREPNHQGSGRRGVSRPLARCVTTLTDYAVTGDSSTDWSLARARVDPLAKAHQAAKAEAEVARAEQARKLEEVRARKAQIRVNRREKKDTSRKLNQRTKWGQPIMKHHMDNILKKLEGEAKN
eukprot:TRINITY_DN9838_c0_g1_i3.p1 TRINITY_DN9838_c0_g1~~TRINITY_DN9838_c0_g1_i3.p1  ORF type:complete len:151 (-),score=11.89 TRINITY_DN9838_c0_g1_i3:351-803(-)